jgi:hypothetical protein
VQLQLAVAGLSPVHTGVCGVAVQSVQFLPHALSVMQAVHSCPDVQRLPSSHSPQFSSLPQLFLPVPHCQPSSSQPGPGLQLSVSLSVAVVAVSLPVSVEVDSSLDVDTSLVVDSSLVVDTSFDVDTSLDVSWPKQMALPSFIMHFLFWAVQSSQ